MKYLTFLSFLLLISCVGTKPTSNEFNLLELLSNNWKHSGLEDCVVFDTWNYSKDFPRRYRRIDHYALYTEFVKDFEKLTSMDIIEHLGAPHHIDTTTLITNDLKVFIYFLERGDGKCQINKKYPSSSPYYILFNLETDLVAYLSLPGCAYMPISKEMRKIYNSDKVKN